MTYLNENYNMVKFELTQKNKIKPLQGVYKIVALPVNFSLNNEELKDFIYQYMKFFRLNYISNTDNTIQSKSKLENSKFIVDLFLEDKLQIKKFKILISQIVKNFIIT